MDKKLFVQKAKEELEKTLVEITNLKELTKPIAPENAIGRISRMDAINNKSVNEASLRSLENRAKKIKIALQRINDKDFGICTRCERVIPEGRLLLMPGATLCVNCA
jgi:RNA polymerase-binding transcription factor